ncbi:unnamed protein product [Zymoseptoria tritici ST99CH_1A5]|uniref:P-loop containing nucleoside triphosphate hydrolase protein n=2 Tax=Zymoseptoria tritici TaxID=1047171 RepID=A0A1X7RQX9_ZYMT9|nr:unnamed protein product [Zymoseptoria tritici ST99CH_3D7]SMY23528.1 unnamed protein product [Zymoseptoria tritici ST99CH_1A5]
MTAPFKRSRPMRVLALGMSRTGTQSVSNALSQLGYDRVYHGHDMGDDAASVYTWRDLWRRKQQHGSARITSQDFDQVLGVCEAVTDAPSVLFWSELMDAYPDATIVLVIRDTEKWYGSFSSVCIDPYCSKRSRLVQSGVRLRLFPYNVLAFLPEMFMGYFQAKTEEQFRSNARVIYEQHNASIVARAENEGRPLLQMRLEDGYEPLCKFLDKSVPDAAFPRGNDAASLRSKTYYGYTLISSLVVLSFLGCCLVPVACYKVLTMLWSKD